MSDASGRTIGMPDDEWDRAQNSGREANNEAIDRVNLSIPERYVADEDNHHQPLEQQQLDGAATNDRFRDAAEWAEHDMVVTPNSHTALRGEDAAEFGRSVVEAASDPNGSTANRRP